MQHLCAVLHASGPFKLLTKLTASSLWARAPQDLLDTSYNIPEPAASAGWVSVHGVIADNSHCMSGIIHSFHLTRQGDGSLRHSSILSRAICQKTARQHAMAGITGFKFTRFTMLPTIEWHALTYKRRAGRAICVKNYAA